MISQGMVPGFSWDGGVNPLAMGLAAKLQIPRHCSVQGLSKLPPSDGELTVGASVAWLQTTRLPSAATRFDASHVSALGTASGIVVVAAPPAEHLAAMRVSPQPRHVLPQLGALGLPWLLLQCMSKLLNLRGFLKLLVKVVLAMML